MALLLVRHASAGDRYVWRGDDLDRPLDERGHTQAAALVETLRTFTIERILTSPARRCLATLEPLAHERGLALLVREELTERLQEVLGSRLLQSLAGSNAVVCGHRGLERAVDGVVSWSLGETLVVSPLLAVVESLPAGA